MSIRFRLTMWYTTLLAVILLIFGVVLYYFLSAKLYNDVENELQAQGAYIQQNISVREFLGVRSYKLPPLQGFKSSSIILQAIWLRNGVLTPDSNVENISFDFSKQAERVVREEKSFSEVLLVALDTNSAPFSLMSYYTPIYVGEKNLVGVLQVSKPINDLETTLRSLEYFLWILGLGALILSASSGWFMARKTLQPIELIIASTRRIEKGADLDQQIDYQGPHDEIGRLVLTINGMLNRIKGAYSELEESYRMQRRFVSDASHELRTPLTTIRGNVDLLEKMWKRAMEDQSHVRGESLADSMEALRDIAEESERISRLVNDLLALARADAGYEMEKGAVDLHSLLEEVGRRAQFLPRTAVWQPAEALGVEGWQLYGNKDYLQQLLFIFIENAFKYTPEGEVRMEVIGSRTDRYIGIQISDTGRGIEQEALPHIFERFYRADVSRGLTPGTGLGLSIAKWIIDEHKGSVEVSSLLGQGTTFTIWLPTLLSSEG